MIANTQYYIDKKFGIRENRRINRNNSPVTNKILLTVHLAIRYSLWGRNEVVSSRYFVPSKTQWRRGRDALHRFVGNERLDGDDKRRWQQRRRLGELARDLDSRAVRSAFVSATCLHRISLSFSLSFFLLFFYFSLRVASWACTHVWRHKSKRTTEANLSIATWRDSFNRLALCSWSNSFFLPLPLPLFCLVFFPSPLQRGKEEA